MYSNQCLRLNERCIQSAQNTQLENLPAPVLALQIAWAVAAEQAFAAAVVEVTASVSGVAAVAAALGAAVVGFAAEGMVYSWYL